MRCSAGAGLRHAWCLASSYHVIGQDANHLKKRMSKMHWMAWRELYLSGPALAGRMMPISSMVYSADVFIILTASPIPMFPSMTRKMTTTPRYGSKYESKISARSGSSSA